MVNRGFSLHMRANSEGDAASHRCRDNVHRWAKDQTSGSSVAWSVSFQERECGRTLVVFSFHHLVQPDERIGYYDGPSYRFGKYPALVLVREEFLSHGNTCAGTHLPIG